VSPALHITPVIYGCLESFHQWFLRKRAKRIAVQTGISHAAA